MQRLLIAFAMLFTLPLPSPFSPLFSTMIQDAATLPLLTPSLQNRKTAKLRLENGLEAWVISDPDATRSAAALAVNVGSWSDPEDQPGLAHFCEHMLFLGTSRYPKESEYGQFITGNGGYTNAYTASDHTNYMFTVRHEAFLEAIDRFSWFFKEPLFNESGVDREIQAIDQEYAKNIPQDHMREFFIWKQVMNPNHPNAHFTMGNAESLKNANPEVLREWYTSHYSSHLMHLVVYSALPLEELTEMVSEKFSAVPQREASPLRTDEPLFAPRQEKNIVYIEPQKDLRTLSLSWELPSHFATLSESKPEEYVGYLLGHEDERSLLAQLKREDLAEGLSAGGYRLGKDNALFRIKISLTDKGLRRLPAIKEKVYQAIARLKVTPPSEALFEEIKKMAQLNYQYQSRVDAFDFVSSHAGMMIHEPLETYPLLTYIPQNFAPQSIIELVSYLRPDNCQVIVSAKSSLTGLSPTHQDPWLGGEYAIQGMTPKTYKRLTQAQPIEAIDLPLPNPFIPQEISLKGTLQKYAGIPHPTLLQEDDHGKIYFQKDQLYLVPEVVWSFKIKTPEIVKGDATRSVLTDLYVRSIREALNPLSYTASTAGLHFSIANGGDGILLNLSGYSDQATALLKEVLSQIKEVHPTEEQFRTYRSSLRRTYENFRQESPLKQGLDELRALLNTPYTKQLEKGKKVRRIRYEALSQFIEQVLKVNYIEGVLYGNMDPKMGEEVKTLLEEHLKGLPYPKANHPTPSVLQLPKERGPFLFSHSVKQPGNATLLVLQNGAFSFEARAAQQILSKGLNEPFFTELRTKQQTGYIVHNWASEIEKQLYSFFAVQSNTHANRDLLARFELLIESFLQEMEKEGLPQERFETIREAFLSEMRQAPKNIQEMTSLLTTFAFEYEGAFNWMEQHIKGMEGLSYQDFKEYATQFLGRSNRKRLGLLIEGTLPEEHRFHYQDVKNLRKMRKMSSYVDREGCTTSSSEPHSK